MPYILLKTNNPAEDAGLFAQINIQLKLESKRYIGQRLFFFRAC